MTRTSRDVAERSGTTVFGKVALPIVLFLHALLFGVLALAGTAVVDALLEPSPWRVPAELAVIASAIVIGTCTALPVLRMARGGAEQNGFDRASIR